MSTDWTGAGSVGKLGASTGAESMRGGVAGVGLAGVQSVGAPVAGVYGRMGCEGVAGLASRQGAGIGLAEGDGGLLGRKS